MQPPMLSEPPRCRPVPVLALKGADSPRGRHRGHSPGHASPPGARSTGGGWSLPASWPDPNSLRQLNPDHDETYRGEDLETLSRALGTTAATLRGWQDSFVAAGEASLATRSTDGEALETERLKAKLGEMLLERELLEAKIAALEANRPLARRRSRR